MTQKRVLVALAICLALVVLFPPWKFHGEWLGYSFIGSPLGRDIYPFGWHPGEVNVPVLLAEMTAVLVIGAVLAVAAKR